jgi:diguanylate cyclase (GGDEF)-like protein
MKRFAREGTGEPGPQAARRRVLLGTTAAALIILVASIVAIGQHDIWPDPGNVIIATAALFGSLLARYRIRVAGELIYVGWAEIGIAAVLCLLPPVWLPIVAVVAVVLGYGPPWPRAKPINRGLMLYVFAGIVVTVGPPAVVASVLAGPRSRLDVSIDQPLSFVPLLLALVTAVIIGTFMSAVWIATAGGASMFARWHQIIRAKRSMLSGSVVVVLAIAVLININEAWLVVLVPLVFGLHRLYEQRFASAGESVTWAGLAEATRALNQLDERGVALAVLRGAANLFRPEAIEVTVVRPQGSRRRFRAETTDLIEGSSQLTIVDLPSPESTVEERSPGSVVSHRMTVGGLELGEVRLLLAPGTALADENGHAFSAFCEAAASSFHDAATHRALRAMTARTAYDALHDSLTGLTNRSTLLARGNAALRLVMGEASVGLILLDVESLRRVNDTLGYAAGDELLALLARRLREGQRDGELVGRLGGDEFAVLITGALDAEGAMDRARGLIRELAEPAEVAGVTLAVEVAAGVVVESAEACDMAELLRRADVARHRAKQIAGRAANYVPAEDPSNTDRLALLAELRDALSETDQFFLHLQPAVDLETGRPVSVEALIRWRHPRRGVLLPADFISTIEHSDLADGFTMHVIELALRVAEGWATQGVHVPVSVNLCARCTLNQGLPALVAARMAAHGVPSHQLILEITESVAMAEPGTAEQVVAGLRDRGAQVSVSNFGTGASSLSFLTRFPVDEVKIDRSFVAAMTDSPEIAAIVRATVDLAQDLGMRVIAEGVDRPAQRDALLELGVTAAQGMLFHPPLPVEEVTAVVQGRTQTATGRHIPIVRTPLP